MPCEGLCPSVCLDVCLAELAAVVAVVEVGSGGFRLVSLGVPSGVSWVFRFFRLMSLVTLLPCFLSETFDNLGTRISSLTIPSKMFQTITHQNPTHLLNEFSRSDLKKNFCCLPNWPLHYHSAS